MSELPISASPRRRRLRHRPRDLASPMGRLPRWAPDSSSDHLTSADDQRRGRKPHHGGRYAGGAPPYREVFHTLWSTKRHVMMGASQLDAYGNQNISCIGSFEAPKAMLIGAALPVTRCIEPLTDPCSVAEQLCEAVDFVCGVGLIVRAPSAHESRYHDLHRVVTNLGVYGFIRKVASLR